jgi:hypothetical protein
MWRVYFILTLLLIVRPAAGADLTPPHCREFKVAACWMETISWVDVRFEGKAAEPYRSEIQKHIRLRFLNDLGSLDQEIISPAEATRGSPLRPDGSVDADALVSVLRKGAVLCEVWTKGSDYPIALLLTCKVESMGLSAMPDSVDYSARSLGYTDRQHLLTAIKDGLQGLIGDISLAFLQDRQKYR